MWTLIVLLHYSVLLEMYVAFMWMPHTHPTQIPLQTMYTRHDSGLPRRTPHLATPPNLLRNKQGLDLASKSIIYGKFLKQVWSMEATTWIGKLEARLTPWALIFLLSESSLSWGGDLGLQQCLFGRVVHVKWHLHKGKDQRFPWRIWHYNEITRK